MQIDFSQRPIEKLNLCEKIFEKLSEFKSTKKYNESILKIKDEANKKFIALSDNVKKLFMAESPVRADFRLSLDRVLSMSSMIKTYFNEKFVRKNILILDMATLSNILLFWIEFLSNPIINALIHVSSAAILETIESLKVDPLEDFIPTISAFESLIVHTLFSGRTNSYISNILWNKGINSFELMQCINSKNRIDFDKSGWLKSRRKLKSSSNLLDQIVSKLRIKSGNAVVNCYKLIFKIQSLERNPYNIRLIAIELWASYFKYLREKAPLDFKQIEKDKSIGNSKYLLISDKVRLSKGETEYKHAVASVFNLNYYNLGISVWTVPYLMAYSEMIKNISKKHLFDQELEIAAETLEIDFFHLNGDETRFFSSGSCHLYKKIAKPIIFIEENETEQAEKNLNSSVKEINCLKRIPFTLEEKIDLCVGINTFGKSDYQSIASCERFGFLSGIHSGKQRTNVNLCNLFRTLLKNKEILTDKETGLFYHRDSSLKDCRGIDSLQIEKRTLNITKSMVKASIQSPEEMIHTFVINSVPKTNQTNIFNDLSNLSQESILVSPLTKFPKRPLNTQFDSNSEIFDLISDIDDEEETMFVINYNSLEDKINDFETNLVTPRSLKKELNNSSSKKIKYEMKALDFENSISFTDKLASENSIIENNLR